MRALFAALSLTVFLFLSVATSTASASFGTCECHCAQVFVGYSSGCGGSGCDSDEAMRSEYWVIYDCLGSGVCCTHSHDLGCSYWEACDIGTDMEAEDCSATLTSMLADLDRQPFVTVQQYRVILEQHGYEFDRTLSRDPETGEITVIEQATEPEGVIEPE